MARSLEFNEEDAIKRAMEVFWKKGYTGTSIRDLAGAMNIQVSSIYNTIGDKHQLFLRCIEGYTQARAQDAQGRASNVKSPLKAVSKFINDAVIAILYGSNSCLAIKTTFEVAATDPALQSILKNDSDWTHNFLADLIRKAIGSGELDATTNADLLADFILSSFTGWHESYIVHKDPVRIKRMAKYLINQISE